MNALSSKNAKEHSFSLRNAFRESQLAIIKFVRHEPHRRWRRGLPVQAAVMLFPTITTQRPL